MYVSAWSEQLYLHRSCSSAFLLIQIFLLSLSCINASSPTWKPFVLIYEQVCTIHIINLSPRWLSSAGIHPPFFILSVCYRVLWTRAKAMHSGIIKRFNRNEVWITILQLYPCCRPLQTSAWVPFFFRLLQWVLAPCSFWRWTLSFD